MLEQGAGLKLGIACPMANEVETAVAFVDEVVAVCRADAHFSTVAFFAVLDSASTDGTREALLGHRSVLPELRVVEAAESRCIVDAYVRGYREALREGCDWVLEIDAGYSHRPADIPRFFARIDAGYDCIFGSRFCAGGDMSRAALNRRVLSRFGTALSNLMLHTRLEDMTSGFQLFSRRAIESILERGIHSRGPFFQTEMKAYCHRMQIAEVPITYSGGSHAIGLPALVDSIAGLLRLYRLRLQGQL
jgi:dolichol-phosphate mannosyltransferase